jgi:hypothetical protein
MKIALCFWGLTRSLKYTINSIKEKVINNLEKHNIEYKIFLHTYETNEIYNNKRAREKNIKLDNYEYKLLKPDYLKIDNLEVVKKNINFKEYYTRGDPWYTNFQSLDNFILAMYSKKELWKLIKNSNQKFDIFMFLRPDVRFLNNIKKEWLSIKDNEINIPFFHSYPRYYNFNDRFAICKYKIAECYSNILDNALEYSKKFKLHSETYIRYNLEKTFQNIKINFINIKFNRVRANGIESIDAK